ncbi:tRNA-splicing endonuclease subunit sen54 N-term-domain-containing protein [Suillus bovinus]|uniref:tRNA-splicing endonuclease subunit sen54 N-term-domain-containing protein n=1 Tax=Suillus bovinus TaxID=48563 RepID=UPI001B85FEF8|nr:tRNA-splicing endonuclease subunit sen54 N-term-domain-containing protein [Suillus bovinus]KAG2147403.1 tRNA-splicing endonuclease subunit sen54 N-term-domain-containing protein [Suillus bovinus]
MDDALEKPRPQLATVNLDPAEEESSGDEDGGLDWTKLPKIGTVRPVIPKRGEKDFEPAPGGGSGLQVHVLDRARAAMFDALKADRAISSKSASYGIWFPQISRVHVTVAKGIHFSVMGHSAARPTSVDGGSTKLQKRLELLPEEALYLIERGALFCWKDIPVDLTGLDDIEGAPMSVQQAFAEIIGKEDLTLEKYQVFAYLRRLGYVVTRTDPPSPGYPVPPPRPRSEAPPSICRTLLSIFSLFTTSILRFWRGPSSWWRPLRISRWIHHDKSYGKVFKSLRVIPAGHSVAPYSSRTTPVAPSSPYKIFYNMYKPSTNFRKSAPPQPDFQIVVINARTAFVPSLYELTELFSVLPEIPPPLPRKRGAPPVNQSSPAAGASSVHTSTFRYILSWLFPSSTPQPMSSQPRPHPFAALKAGKKNIVIAAVDSGNISFFRFSQGAFEEWPTL